MDKAIIATNQLTFSFSHKANPVLNDINLNVPQGSIYGFLGPNGAGKTTTMRLLLGLLPSQKNTIKIFGQTLSDSPMAIYSRIGAFIESPSLYEHLSGAQNLEITRRLKNVERTRIAQVLREVNLTKAANVTVKKYSLGMKQRLGLALALLSRPELLILDEPTNGLDPNGINEIRELLIDLNRATGTTIFLSSHLLAEIEKMASHVGIIFNGSIVVQGIMQELIDSSAQVHMLEIRTNDNQKSMSILQASNFLVLTGSNQMLQIKVNSLQEVGMITKLLVRHEVNIFQILHKRRGLEEIYLSITQS